MSELKTNLDEILQEKQDKIIPANIKKDVQIFDVIGTYTGNSGTDYEVKLFETEEEMQADENAQEGDLAVVYRSEIQNMTVDTQTQYITFPETVTLPEALTESYYCRLRAIDPSRMFDGNVQLGATSFRFDGFSDNGMIRVEYTSTDGITYTRNTFEGDSGELSNPVDLGTVIHCEMQEEWNDNFGYFMQIGGSTFEGLYEYNGAQYYLTPTQLTTTKDLVYNSIYYGKDGVNEGTLTQNVSNSFADVNAKIVFEIQQAYENMKPRILTNTDKTIDKNIYFIPTKSNGTPLLDTSQVTDMTYLFTGCTNLQTIPLLDTSNTTITKGMFSNCTGISEVSKLDLSHVTDMSYMFNGCSELKTIPQFDVGNATKTGSMFYGCAKLITVPQLNTIKVASMNNMFFDCASLQSVPQLDTTNVTNMDYMFSNCTNLQDISNLNVTNVETAKRMFQGCTNLQDASILSEGAIDDIQYMFYKCTNLVSVSMPNITNVGNTSGMFKDCINLKTVVLPDTSKVDYMSSMFSNCSNLVEISLFSTNNVIYIISMFENCTSLTTVPQFDVTNIESMQNAFDNCPSLSDDSLNNILAMCTNATKIKSNKTLKYIGLTQEQTQKCTTLSNYQAFTAAGWTTGY